MSATVSRPGRLAAAVFAALVLAFTGIGVGTAAAADSHHGDSGYSSHHNGHHDNGRYSGFVRYDDDHGHNGGHGDHDHGRFGDHGDHDHGRFGGHGDDDHGHNDGHGDHDRW